MFPTSPIEKTGQGFELLRSGGVLGLIATNTIAKGDTHSTGLRFICNHGSIVYNATSRYKWPGLAAVVVSLVHRVNTESLEAPSL